MSGAGGPTGFPESFVGLDLETTGVDSSVDLIIEVGAIRFENGVPVEEMAALVDPGCPIPTDVVHLTGITDEDVRGAPRIDEILDPLLEFLADDPIVAHHAPFDLGFLNTAAKETPGKLFGSGGVYDTLVLSRVVIPRLTNHRLQTVAAFFDVPVDRSHRAPDDARTVARVFLRLIGLFCELGPALLRDMARLADPQTRTLIDAALIEAERTLAPRAVPDHGAKAAELVRYDNARRTDLRRTPREETAELDLDELVGLFDAGGAIAERLPGYEERAEQLRMMRAVGDSLNSGVHLVVEAGTGVGKSLAYLAPAAHFAAANGERIVVSTGTRNLQEQLFKKDIPFLEETLDVEFSSALLKGRSNYLCEHRWRQLLERGLSAQERARLLPVVVWEAETASGDISENTAFRTRGYLWSRISADGGPCLGQACPYRDECYLIRARRNAQAANLVVVNHSLLFSDTETDNRVLGDYAYAICDEAHNIEETATEHLGRRASHWRVRSVLDSIDRKDGEESGIVADLLEGLRRTDSSGSADAVLVAAERCRADVAAASGRAEDFFGLLLERHRDLNDGQQVEFGRLRCREGSSVASILAPELEALTTALSTAAESASTLADLSADLDVDQEEAIFQNLLYQSERARELAVDLEYLASAADPESVFWLEVRTFREKTECELRCAPVSVADKMEAFLYSRVESLVMTSATLTVDGRFDFFMERVGLDLLPDWKVQTLNVGSPYDYDAQAVAVVAGHLPAPSSPGFNGVVADIISRAVPGVEGGTLVLFTSRSSLDAVFRLVRDPLTARGKVVLAQGHSGSASAILDEFTRVTDSVLLATRSFWEGVDVPGRSLELLVIVKLPFPVPSDPVIQAHCELYDRAGVGSFGRYMVPRTAIRLRQGFGRLIRSTKDSGVVALLDSRLVTKRYGERLLEQLPTTVRILRSDASLLEAMGAAPAGFEIEG